METADLAARLLLAAALALAAAAKLADPAGAETGALALGAPRALARPVAAALPLLELGAACLLLPAATAAAGAVLALALLAVFSAALALALARGTEVDCRCFGQLSAAAAGPRALARNAALVGLALLSLAAGGLDPGRDATPALAGLAGVATVGLGLRRRRRPSPGAPPAFPPWPPAPAFLLESREGDPTSLSDLLVAGRPLLLVFLDDPPSPSLARLLAETERYGSHQVTVAVVAGRPEVAPAEIGRALLDREGRARRAFGLDEAPSAVLVTPGGRLAAVGKGEEAVERLAAQAPALEEEPAERWLDGPPLGAPLPPLELVDRAGRRQRLAGQAGEETVILLWRPGCRPCRDLYGRLRAWERRRPAGAPHLLVVSLGGPDEAVDRFSSPTLYDPELTAVDALAGGHAPAALRVDARGRVASSLAVGAEAVLSLLQP